MHLSNQVSNGCRRIIVLLTESEIYLRMKEWLTKRNWIILGGEPPGGTNNIPIIEIKLAVRHKGSYGSKKVDLATFREGFFMLIELKQKYTASDFEKLDLIVGDSTWRTAFLRALREKSLLKKAGINLTYGAQAYIGSTNLFIKAVGFNFEGRLGKPDYITFIPWESSVKPIAGKQIKDNVQKLLEK
jgi:hypothetical protein